MVFGDCNMGGICSKHTLPKYEVMVYHVNLDNVDLGCTIFRIDDHNPERKTQIGVLQGFNSPESLVSELIGRGYDDCGFSSTASRSSDMMALDMNELEQIILAWSKISLRV